MVYKEREYFGDPADPERQRNSQLEADVAAALGASGRLDAIDVVVTVMSGSTIILSGWVVEEAEVGRCMETARNVPGVEHVESTIAVRNATPPVNRSL